MILSINNANLDTIEIGSVWHVLCKSVRLNACQVRVCEIDIHMKQNVLTIPVYTYLCCMHRLAVHSRQEIATNPIPYLQTECYLRLD